MDHECAVRGTDFSTEGKPVISSDRRHRGAHHDPAWPSPSRRESRAAGGGASPGPVPLGARLSGPYRCRLLGHGVAQETWVAEFQTATPDVTVTTPLTFGAGRTPYGGAPTFPAPTAPFCGERAERVESAAPRHQAIHLPVYMPRSPSSTNSCGGQPQAGRAPVAASSRVKAPSGRRRNRRPERGVNLPTHITPFTSETPAPRRTHRHLNGPRPRGVGRQARREWPYPGVRPRRKPPASRRGDHCAEHRLRLAPGPGEPRVGRY